MGWGLIDWSYWKEPGDCSAVATRTQTALSQRLPFLTPTQAKGCSPETWTWMRRNGIHLKHYPLVLEGGQSHALPSSLPQLEGGDPSLLGWCRDRMKRIFKGNGVMVCLWFQAASISRNEANLLGSLLQGLAV